MATWLTARLADGDLRVSVVSAHPYGENGRTATASVDIPDSDLAEARDVLATLLAAYQSQAERQARVAAARALVVALDREEA